MIAPQDIKAHVLTLDFETFFGDDYTLKKLTTESYIRDPRFEVLGLGVRHSNGELEWVDGTKGRCLPLCLTPDAAKVGRGETVAIFQAIAEHAIDTNLCAPDQRDRQSYVRARNRRRRHRRSRLRE